MYDVKGALFCIALKMRKEGKSREAIQYKSQFFAQRSPPFYESVAGPEAEPPNCANCSVRDP